MQPANVTQLLLNIYTHPSRDVILIIHISRMLSLKSHASFEVSRICNRNITVHKQYFPDVYWFEGLLKMCFSLSTQIHFTTKVHFA
jgi:hypothetical protein